MREYGFTDAYFTDPGEEPFASAQEERETYLRFIDMLCMISIYQNENKPEEAVDRVGTLLRDVDLMKALEPHDKVQFPAFNRIRFIFSKLLLKGKNSLLDGKTVPLSRLFFSGELREVEILTVLVALSSSINRKYERIYGILQEEKDGILRPTVGLVHDLGRFFIPEEENDVSILLNPDSFMNIILLEQASAYKTGSEMSREIRLRNQAINFLFDRKEVLGELALCSEYRETSEYDYVCRPEVVYELKNVYGAMTEMQEIGVIEIAGEMGAGKRHIMGLVANTFVQKLLCVSFRSMEVLSNEKQQELISDIVLKSILEDDVIYVYDFPDGAEHERNISRIMASFQAYLRIIFIGPAKPLHERVASGLKGNVYRVELPEIDDKAQAKLWMEAAERMQGVFSADVNLEELVSKYTMNPGRIFEAVKNTIMLADVTEDGFLLEKEKLEEQIRRICSVSFGENAKRLKSPFVWEDLIIEPESERLLKHVCDRIRFKSKVNDDFGFGKKLPYGRGISVVLYGPPGTGKTMAAQVLARELGLDIYRIDLSQISSKYIGETEKNLGAVFEAAKNSNSILFFDEADSLFAKRTEVSSSNDKHANAETAYLLQKIEEYSGMSVLATNNMQNFDAAFKRRMTYLIPVGIPDEETRKKLWKQAFPEDAPLSADVDFDILAKAVEISGSYIKSSAIAAAYRAAAENRNITMMDIAEATDLECMKNGKMGVKNDILQELYNG